MSGSPFRPPPLLRLQCFLFVARTGSVAAAAAAMHLSAGAVSRQLSALERHVGVRLFERKGRLTLTHAGREYAADVAEILRAFERATNRMRNAAASDTIRVSCESTLALRWLLPRLPSWYEAPGNVPIHLDTGGGHIDPARSGIDLAIRRFDFHLPAEVESIPLMQEYIGPVCAPERARAPASLPRILSDTRPHAWEDWQQASGKGWPSRAPTRLFGHFFLAIAAAERAQGVAIAPYPLVQDAVRAGQLVAPCGFIATPTRYIALAKRESLGNDSVHRFVDWLCGQARTAVP